MKHIAAILIFLSASLVAMPNNNASADSIPKPEVPVYNKLKPLFLKTALVEKSATKVTIYAPGAYASMGKSIQQAIRKSTGIDVPLVTSVNQAPAVPVTENLILLGNRSTNSAISKLYDRGFTYLDLKYPGTGGYLVRSLHNPYGNGHNIIFAGGSDDEGVHKATKKLVNIIASHSPASNSLSLGYLCNISLSPAYVLPDSSSTAEIWDASRQYNSTGYFGWNSISKYMALYYMTNEERYLQHFLRLSFPDSEAIKEMERLDGELIENKKDPLSGPYHYGAHMMICLWDLIEETPALSDEQRLKITNAFARQLTHRVVEYGSIYSNTTPPRHVGDRHDDWAAFSLYVLGLYFNRDYPSDVWQHCIKAADLHFSALKHTTWVAGNNDHLFWFTSFYDPMINYLVVSGNREKLRLENLRKALKTQEITYTGNREDWGLKTSTVSMLNKAAYLLNDSRWLYFRERNGVNTDGFRLGQSFWPSEDMNVSGPADLVGKWTVEWMQPDMWKFRNSVIPQQQAFRWGSYRSTVKEDGDLLMIKGYNGAGRNPYHSFALLELRLNGNTLLKGYNNQVFTSSDGMVEPKVAMDAALIYQGVTGEMVSSVSEVPQLSFANWRRTIALRKNKWALVADQLEFRTEKENLTAVTSWESAGAVWSEKDRALTIRPELQNGKAAKYQLLTSEPMTVVDGKVSKMQWTGVTEKGKKKMFFHLIAESPKDNTALACLKVTDNAAVFATPEIHLVVCGAYEGTTGSMMIVSPTSLYGNALTAAVLHEKVFSSTNPVNLYWDFLKGEMDVQSTTPAVIGLPITSQHVFLNGKKVAVKKVNGKYQLAIPVGSHKISNVFLPSAVLTGIKEALDETYRTASSDSHQRVVEKTIDSRSTDLKPGVLFTAQVGPNPVESITIPTSTGNLFCTASGTTVSVLDAKGKTTMQLKVQGEVKVLRWWAEPRLLLVGCADEKVIAFDMSGNEKWSFTSVMDPAVYEAGKQYWFKSAYPGVHGLYTGKFDGGKSRAFVGSACTLEIIDDNGQLVKRLPIFWSVIKQFLLLDEKNGERKLLVGGWQTGTNELFAISSKTLSESGHGYIGVPDNHSFVGGWMTMNRYDNFYADLNDDGKKEVTSAINGSWNRITVYSEDGKARFNAQVGPGTVHPRSNIRMMDVGDINEDGKQEIVVALSSGFIDVLDHEAKKIWAKVLPSSPVLVKILHEGTGNKICAATEDGQVYFFDAKGSIRNVGRSGGRPADMRVLKSVSGEPVVVITSVSGEVTAFESSKRLAFAD